MAQSNKTKRGGSNSTSSTTASDNSNNTASAAIKAPTLARAPSLSVLVETMRSQNPDKWDKIAQKADSKNTDSTTTGSTNNDKAAPPAVAAAGPGSVVPTSALTASLAAHNDTAVDVASLDMNRRGSNASTSSSGTSAAPGSSIDGTPRLRLPARLAANASAPLLSRSQSTSAIVQSGSLAPADTLDSTLAGSSISSSLMTTSTSLGAGPASTAATSVASTLPSSLCTTLARRGSLSTNNGALPPSLPNNRGIPSLEAIEKRFALKKEMEKLNDGQIDKVLDNQAAAVKAVESGGVLAGARPPGLLTSTAVGKQFESSSVVTLLAGKTAETPSEARKENIDPKTGLDSTVRTSAPSVHFTSSQAADQQANISSHSLAVTASSSSSDSSVSPPTTPTDAAPLPLNRKAAALAAPGGQKAPDHPLEHKWTLYYDSRATARAAAAAAGKATTPTSATHPTPITPVVGSAGNNKHQYEAGLSVLGSVQTVESFCRLYNWLKKPSRMGKDENLHFFKDDILPMWEDDHNKHGGKWTVCLDLKIGGVKELVDKLWMWLCFALIGEDFDEKDDIICGAVISTRARMFRFQVWLKNREDTASINAIGKQLIKILELQGPSNTGNSGHTTARLPGMSLDFSYHGKGTPPPNKFVHISAHAFPAPSAAFQAAPGSKMLNPSPGIGIGSAGGGGGAASNTFNRPIGFGGASHPGNAFGSLGSGSGNGATSSGLARAASMNAISAKLSGNGGGGARESAQLGNGHPGPMNWRERLGQTARKCSMAAS